MKKLAAVPVMLFLSSITLAPVVFSQVPDTAAIEVAVAKLDLNQITAEQLESLPGIGKVKAAAIIAYREKVGKFSSLEEIKEVKGISDKTLEKLSSYLYVHN